MKTNIISVTSLNGLGVSEFFNKIHERPEITKDFAVSRLDTTSITEVLKESIIGHGTSSLFRYTITCDSVLHPGFHVDEIENVILGFVRKLNAAKNLLIIDPYLYSKHSDKMETLNLFEKMVGELSENLETVTIITDGRNTIAKSAMHSVLRKVTPKVLIKDVPKDEFHDRYWIDLDNQQGIVMGTSLNGITKKICLVDHISKADVRQIIELAQSVGLGDGAWPEDKL